MALFSVGDTIGEHWTVEAVVTPKSFMVRCSCGRLDFHTATQLLGHSGGGPQSIIRSCGCQNPRV